MVENWIWWMVKIKNKILTDEDLQWAAEVFTILHEVIAFGEDHIVGRKKIDVFLIAGGKSKGVSSFNKIQTRF